MAVTSALAISTLTFGQFEGATASLRSPAALLDTIFDSRLDVLTRPSDLTPPLAELGVVWAVIFLVLGAICVFNGYRWHKAVILVLALMVGAAAGHLLGARIGVAEVVTSIAGAALLGVLAWPILRYTVALFAGIAGAFCGANVWSAAGQPPDQHYVGAIIGLIVLGMLAFITFRIVIIAFTAIGGASLLVFGTLALLLRLDGLRGGIEDSLAQHPLVLPIIGASTALFGIVYQQGGGMKGLLDSASACDKQGGKPAGKGATAS